jgi:hypothetical protein
LFQVCASIFIVHILIFKFSHDISIVFHLQPIETFSLSLFFLVHSFLLLIIFICNLTINIEYKVLLFISDGALRLIKRCTISSIG